MSIYKIKLYTYKYPYFRKLLYPVIVARHHFQNNKYHEMLINNITEMLVVDPIVKLNDLNGIFEVDRRSDIFREILRTKQFEPDIINKAALLLNNTRDVLDVGANIGFFTVFFAKKLKDKKVLSIEPTSNALNHLNKNIGLNKIKDNVIVFEGAASNKEGYAEIKTIDGMEEYSSLGEWIHPSIIKEKYVLQKVKLQTVDNLVQMYSLDPGFMKVDVEGMEYNVFQGATNTLKKHRPIILSELSAPLLKANGASAMEVINYIKSFEYNVTDIFTPELSPGTQDFTNIICIPTEYNN